MKVLNGEKKHLPEHTDKSPEEIKLKMHPTLIFATRIRKEKTDSGIYIPESAQDKEVTPLVEIVKIGENVQWVKEGDIVYVDPSYMRMVRMDGVIGIVVFEDAILAKVENQ